MSKKKKLELANENIPQDEMILAMILQNAKANGIGFCERSYYRDSDGMPCLYDEAVCACTLGAAALENDTVNHIANFAFVISGNDGGENWTPSTLNFNSAFCDGETIGYAYRQAMTVDEG